MVKGNNENNRGRAAALIPLRSAAALLLCLLSVVIATGRALGQVSRIEGGQLRIATNLQTGSTYTIGTSDCGKLLSISNAGGVAVSLPQAGVGGLFNGCWVDIQNAGLGTATLTPDASLIDGASDLSLAPNQGVRLISNGSGYFTQRGQGAVGGGGGGGGTLSVQSGGTALGPANTLNVVGGTGVSCVPQVTGGVATLQCNADTSYVLSRATLQGSSNPQLCTSASGSGVAYTSTCGTPLTAYATKQTLFWYADVANTSTAPTLNIDTLGATPLLRHDGTALSVGDIGAGVLYRIWNDGSNLRVVEAGLGSGGGSPAGGAGAGGSVGGTAGPTGTLAMNGSDVTLYTFAGVPALAAGACYEFKGVMMGSSSYTVKVKVDGITISTPISGASGGYYVGFNTLYCNNAGSQTAQSLVPFYAYYVAVYQQAQGPINYFGEGPGSYPIAPQAINWATTHTITVTINAASGTGQATFFRYN